MGVETDPDWTKAIAEPLTAPLERTARDFGEHVAIDFLGRHTTWRELSEQIDRLARGLAAIGVGKGTRVGLLLPNTPYYVASYYAIARLGAVVVNLNPLYADAEIEALLVDSGAEVVVTLDLALMLPKLLGCFERTALRRVVVASMAEALPRHMGLMFQLLRRKELIRVPDDGRCITYGRVMDIGTDAVMPEVEIDPMTDLAVLQYTGGTTGLPKGAMLTHANLVTNAAQVTAWYEGHERGTDRMLGVLPLFHVFAMTVVMNMAVQLGATMILLPRFKLAQVLKTIQRKKPTIFPAVPTLLNAIDKEKSIGRYDLSSLEFCISGGAPLPVEVKESFEARTGCAVVEGYGLSEASPVVTCNPSKGVNKPGSIGLPMPGTTVSVRDPEQPEVEMPMGELGEICVRGPTVMRGYWHKPEETEAVFIDHSDGKWLRTGDMGRVDEDGYVFLVDRIKDLIIVNGYNVYPRMIEEALYSHPAIAEATVIGVEDDKYGEVPKAFIVLRTGEELEIDELRAFLEPKLSPMQQLREIEIRTELPKTMIGKLSKKELVAEERAARKSTVVAE